MSWHSGKCVHGHGLRLHSTELWREGAQWRGEDEGPLRTLEHHRGWDAATEAWCRLCAALDWVTTTVREALK